jgi:Xaa-Pro aminopeptidase
MNTIYRKRLKKVFNTLRKLAQPSALLLGSNTELPRSRDSYFPFRQSSDFYYCTGSLLRNTLLLVSTREKRPMLISPPLPKGPAVWDDPQPSARRLAASLDMNYLSSDKPEKEVLERLKGIDTLYFQNEPYSAGWKLAQAILARPSHQRASQPAKFMHSDCLLEPLRLHKEPSEIEAIKAAAEITNSSLFSAMPFIQAGISEVQLCATIDYFMALGASTPSFPTIVARGKNAAILHHSPSAGALLKEGELVLIDCGSLYEGYASDITRTLPVSGAFSSAQTELYLLVLEAQTAALSKIKAGAPISAPYTAAARVLIQGLKDLKVLKGSFKTLLASPRFKTYFPHGIGHSLGLDVHDIGTLRSDRNSLLEEGMVITVEPGIYFAKPVRKIPACGLRIEDDVLVTKHGCQVLSAGFPKLPDEIEGLVG